MEVLVQDIKQEQSAGDSRKDASQRTHISPSNHHSGGTTTSGKFNNNNHQNSNNLSILQNTLTNSNSNNNNHNANASTDSLTVIQTPSVIQSASGHLQLSKGNVILVSSKPNSSVIQTTGGAIQTVQVLQEPHHSDESLSNDGVDHPSIRERRRRDILTRRPSYRKILNDLGASEIEDKGDSPGTSESSQDPLDNSSGNIVIGGSQYPSGVVKVINASTLGLGVNTSADANNSATALQTITMTNAGTAGGTIVQYAQSHDGQQFFVPVGVSGGGGHHPPEEQTRKREIRLLKNREAARECRRKKKEYIKCLENRVAVLENQNKALIDELKSLKELYCQQKTE